MIMKRLRDIIKSYIKGAKANYRPISKYGLFGGKIKNPATLEQVLFALGKIIEQDKETVRFIQEHKEETVSTQLHHTLGRYIRNRWSLWHKTKLTGWFNKRGITHPDDMSGIIITSYWRQQHREPIRLDVQIQHYKDYWKHAEEVIHERAIRRLTDE